MKKEGIFKRLLATLLIAVVAFSSEVVALPTEASAAQEQLVIEIPEVDPPTSYTEVYDRLTVWKEKIPEGTLWDDVTPYGDQGYLGKYYVWKGGTVDGAIIQHTGCSAFTSVVSDGLFGNLPATKINRGNFKFEDVRVGDILRVNGNSHSVIVWKTTQEGVIVAEANIGGTKVGQLGIGGKVVWGRAMSKEDVEFADFLLTRYPKNFVSSDTEEANKVVDQGKEEKLTWTLTKRGVLTISGTGAMPNFSTEKPASWNKPSVSSIVIGSGITSIGNYAFYGSQALGVTIPNTVNSIGECAFMNSQLVGVSIPGSVITVGNNSFSNCANLASLKLYEGTKTIGDYAFSNCTNLGNLVLSIPASVTEVGIAAFKSCSSLIKVKFESSNHPVTIKSDAFIQCWKMLNIALPEKLVGISSGMFYGCKMLTYLYIPANVEICTVLGEPALTPPFMGTSLVQIDFGGSEADWQRLGGAQAVNEAHIGKPTVNCNVPIVPVEPTVPTKPETPTEPAEPTTPVEPTEPTVPTEPETPTVPVEPVKPETPTPSETPTNTGNTGNTDKPSNTNKPKEKVTYAYKQKTKGTYTYLYNSKNKKVDFFKLKSGKLTYKAKNGKKVNLKSVKYSRFNGKGNILAICKNTTYYSINYNTGKVKKLGTKAKKFKYDSKSKLATKVVLKNGKKKDVSKK